MNGAQFLLAAIILAVTPQTVQPLRVHDGDTFTAVGADKVAAEYRLWGVDAPELDQAWGKVSRAALLELVQGRRVTVTPCGSHFQRVVVRVTSGAGDVGIALLSLGLAWHDRRFAPDRADYAAAEAEARAARRGLWSEDSPVAPWEWRQRRKKEK